MQKYCPRDLENDGLAGRLHIFQIGQLISDSEFLLVIRAGRIQRSGRIVSGDAVLGDKGGDIGIGIAVEKAVVTDAKADDDIEVGPGLIQEACLKNGVAHSRPDLFTLSRNAHRSLCTAFNLTDDCVWFEAVGSENSGEDAGFIDKTDAVGDADLAGTDLTGKLHYFLNTGPLTVTLVLHFGTGLHYLEIAVFFIMLERPGGVLVGKVGRETEIRICPCLEFAVLCSAVNTAEGLFVHKIHFNISTKLTIYFLIFEGKEASI